MRACKIKALFWLVEFSFYIKRKISGKNKTNKTKYNREPLKLMDLAISKRDHSKKLSHDATMRWEDHWLNRVSSVIIFEWEIYRFQSSDKRSFDGGPWTLEGLWFCTKWILPVTQLNHLSAIYLMDFSDGQIKRTQSRVLLKQKTWTRDQVTKPRSNTLILLIIERRIGLLDR